MKRIFPNGYVQDLKVCIFSGTAVSKNQTTIDTSFNDKVFLFEEMRLAFDKFVKFDMRAEVETSISHLIRLDAIITDAIDSLAHAIKNMEHILKEGHASLAAEFGSRDERDKKKRKTVYGCGGRVLQKLAKRVKWLLPLAFSQYLTYLSAEGVGGI